ncbi:PAS domain-containing protein [Arachnia rubra]|jgi:putative PAS/PAC sensor protein|nr:PAS domain-containing protein [Arachnia rubra]BCR80232.1 hypothetical protein SK1NUM_06750 [Arachnia rubra]
MKKLGDMTGPGRAAQWTYYDGSSRQVVVTDVETRFPTGELIVSQTDRDGMITTCNEAFVIMSGFTKEELIGAPHAILRHPDMPRAAYQDLWSTVQQGKRWSGYVKNLRADGGYYWVYATVIPKVRNGQILGHTSVRREPSRDKVAEMEKLYAEMVKAEGR